MFIAPNHKPPAPVGRADTTLNLATYESVRSSDRRKLVEAGTYKHATPIGVNNSLQVPSTTLVP